MDKQNIRGSDKDNYMEAFHQERQIGEVIPNQWSLRLKKIESFLLPNERTTRSSSAIDIKRSLLLKKDGKASITFDISTFSKYTISIINESEHRISFCLELSPDNIHFVNKIPYTDLNPKQVECVTAIEYLKFAKVKISGKKISSVTIFLQGIKII